MQSGFAEQMNNHWVQKLGRAVSDPLIAGWNQLEQATNRMDDGVPYWQVVQLPTGAGKTEALKLLCSRFGPIDHPGILIVTKFRTEAERIALGINEHAGWAMAKAIYGANKPAAEDMAWASVLVITHARYEAALRDLSNGASERWNDLHRYGCGKRRWVVIDEAFNWTDAYSVQLGTLSAAAGELAARVPEELRRDTNRLLELARELTDGELAGRSAKPLTSEQIGTIRTTDFAALHHLISETPASAFAERTMVNSNPDGEREGATDRTEHGCPQLSRDAYLEALDQMRTIAAIGYAWVARMAAETHIHASRSLLGFADVQGIILDATASVDRTYVLQSQRVQLLPRPQNIRRYDNVTLYRSTGHRVGKEYLTHKVREVWPVVWADLKSRLAGKNVLVCCHASVHRYVQANAQLQSGQVRVAHWGDIDGKNDWQDFDSVVVFGLPYLDDIAPAQTFFAYVGPRMDEWFTGSRSYGDYEDMRNELQDGFINRNVVQAINRVRCRNIIDAEGNCAPTEIYMLSPNGRTGDALENAIIEQMPGIQLRDWSVKVAKRKPRTASTECKLIEFFRDAGTGAYPRADIAQAIAINPRTFERYTRPLTDPTSPQAIKLAAIQTRYVPIAGRGSKSVFIKH